MSSPRTHRLDGLEPDNLLAFLALLGLLRALEAADRVRLTGDKLRPRAAWDFDSPPVRPSLYVSRHMTHEEVVDRVERGIEELKACYDFDRRKDLNYSREECRALLNEAGEASVLERDRIDLLAALMSDAAIKDDKKQLIDPTPLCLLFGQGHQHFLDRLARVPHEPAPPPRGRGRSAVPVSGVQSLGETLFQPWNRPDPTPSFRWDPEEDVRYALQAGDPTDASYQAGTQHGANRLAAIGLATITLVPQLRGGRVRPGIAGGVPGATGFMFAWPLWRPPSSLAAIRALLVHPDLAQPDALEHLEVDHVMIARRISVGKFMNFSRGRPLERAADARRLHG